MPTKIVKKCDCGAENEVWQKTCHSCHKSLFDAPTASVSEPLRPVDPEAMPMRIEIERPGDGEINRWSVFYKWLWAVPLYFILVFYGLVAWVITFVALWPILFTGRYPRWMFDFVTGFWRFAFRVVAYFPLLMTDWWSPDDSHPLKYEVDYPENESRLILIFLKLPSAVFGIVQILISVAVFILFGNGFVTGWCILLTGKYPKSQFEINKNIMTWAAQTFAWQWLMRDDAKLFGTTSAVKLWVLIGIVGYTALVVIGFAVGD